VGNVQPRWFSARPNGAVRDFFDLFEEASDALSDIARELPRTTGPLPQSDVDREVAESRERLRRARAGDWRPYEERLRSLGATYARAGMAFSAWHSISYRFYESMVTRAVAAFAGEPARLTQVLLVVGEYTERSLSIIADHYYAAKDKLQREAAARIEILSTTGHEFAAASGDTDTQRLLGLVARRLGEVIGDGCAVRLISDDGAWLEPSRSFYHRDLASRDLANRVLATERQRVGEGLAGRVAATGEPVLIPRIDTEQLLAATAPQFGAMLRQLGVTSALAIPLRSRGRTIGAISLLRTRPDDPYTLEDQYLAQDLADRAGLAIDNAVLVGTLEQRVAERTAALETSNRELEAFSYSVSHDLRTPLRAIDGFSRALLADFDHKLDERGRHYLHRTRSATQRMSALIDDLLELARITRLAIRREPVDLSAIANDVIADLRRRDPARTVWVHIAAGLVAFADARLVHIVIENLLGNAWKFTAKHERAEIWFDAVGPTFHVRDTGVGFDMTYAEKLFSPFQRLHAARDYDGTGVGLAIVHRIVGHHGGRIWAEAEVDKGATFFFTLGDPA